MVGVLWIFHVDFSNSTNMLSQFLSCPTQEVHTVKKTRTLIGLVQYRWPAGGSNSMVVIFQEFLGLFCTQIFDCHRTGTYTESSALCFFSPSESGRPWSWYWRMMFAKTVRSKGSHFTFGDLFYWGLSHVESDSNALAVLNGNGSTIWVFQEAWATLQLSPFWVCMTKKRHSW